MQWKHFKKKKKKGKTLCFIYIKTGPLPITENKRYYQQKRKMTSKIRLIGHILVNEHLWAESIKLSFHCVQPHAGRGKEGKRKQGTTKILSYPLIWKNDFCKRKKKYRQMWIFIDLSSFLTSQINRNNYKADDPTFCNRNQTLKWGKEQVVIKNLLTKKSHKWTCYSFVERKEVISALPNVPSQPRYAHICQQQTTSSPWPLSNSRTSRP